jgi:high-affinity iron transporter
LLLLAIFPQSAGVEAPVVPLLGLLASVAVGCVIYIGGVRIDLRRFFRWTGIFILVVAAGLLAGSLRHLHEAGLWNYFQTTAFDLSGVLPADSLLGVMLSGVFGYLEAPTVGEFVLYAAFLVISLFAFLRPMAHQAAGAEMVQPSR